MTIKEVAKQAGVSTATISRVINNTGVVNKRTRDKILRIIKELSYKPTTRQKIRSSGASSLKHKNIALIWTGDSAVAFSETARTIVMGVLHQLQALGAKLTVDYITESGHIPQCIREGKIDGVLLHGPEPSAAICERLRQLAVVWILQSGSVEFGDRVQPNHNILGRISATHLIEQGCQQLCCISYTRSHTDQPYWQSRANGFVNCAKVRQANCTVLHCSANQEDSERHTRAKELVDAFEKISPAPDGLFVTNDFGNLIHGELIRRGITPMKDLMVIAGDVSEHPKVIDLRLFNKELGQLSVDSLLWRIKNPDMPIVTHSIPPELIIP
jgi:LacI family transcriptional regulator